MITNFNTYKKLMITYLIIIIILHRQHSIAIFDAFRAIIWLIYNLIK